MTCGTKKLINYKTKQQEHPRQLVLRPSHVGLNNNSKNNNNNYKIMYET